jgi:tRNA (guanine37-N1)-methyltransferase
MKRSTVITLFPELVTCYAGISILGKAVDSGLIQIDCENPRAHSKTRYQSVDDTPAGGGPGQVMRIDIMVEAIRAVQARHASLRVDDDAKRAHHASDLGHDQDAPRTRIILTDPAAPRFLQSDARRLASYDHLIFVCGRYEGIDARIYHYVDEAFSIGDFVMTGGELAALAMLDATLRHVPGVLGNAESAQFESHEAALLEHSQYTRPAMFEGHGIPAVLQGGNHALIARERYKESLVRTAEVRPDLLANNPPDEKALQILNEATKNPPDYPWQHLKKIN